MRTVHPAPGLQAGSEPALRAPLIRLLEGDPCLLGPVVSFMITAYLTNYYQMIKSKSTFKHEELWDAMSWELST